VGGGDFFDPFEILAPDHEVNVPSQRGEFRVGLLNMYENRQAANQFVRHALVRQHLGDFVQHANQIEQPFLKQAIDRFPFRRGVTKELFEGESAH